jgi:hypothetical protein
MPLRPDHHLSTPVAAPPWEHSHDRGPPHDPTDEPDYGTESALADLLAGLFGLVVAALGILIACGWLTTLWSAALLAVLLLGPLILMLAVVLQR